MQHIIKKISYKKVTNYFTDKKHSRSILQNTNTVKKKKCLHLSSLSIPAGSVCA